MKFRTHKQEEDVQISLTPLIDVVFILLIFFMVTTTFDRTSELRIELPDATATENTAKDTLEIAIDAKGQFFVNQVRVISTSPKALYLAISKVVADRKDMPVVLKADGKTPHQFVVTAMDTIGRLGMTRLSIATVEGQ